MTKHYLESFDPAVEAIDVFLQTWSDNARKDTKPLGAEQINEDTQTLLNSNTAFEAKIKNDTETKLKNVKKIAR